MGACASKFTVLKNASTGPPPAVKCEVESGEVHLVEEVAVEKDDAPAVDDEAKRRQSLGHLLQEGEEKKGSADSNDKASEDAAEVKLEAVADAAAQDEREKAPVADGLKLKCTEEDIPAKQNAEIEANKPAETLKPETTAVEITCADDKEPEILETEVKKPSSDEVNKEEKLAEAETSEEQCPAPDAEKKETDEKSTEIMETTPKEPEATEKQEPAEKKNSDEKPCEISNEKPESPESEKAADTDKNIMEEKPAENSKTETSDKVEDKHVLEPQTTQDLLASNAPEACSEEQKPSPDAEKTKAEEDKTK